jgi:hypothetical protein
MSLEDFNNHYFYAKELQAFAKTLGIKVGSLKKNELEAHIRAYLAGDQMAMLPQSVPNRKTKVKEITFNCNNPSSIMSATAPPKHFCLPKLQKKTPKLEKNPANGTG